VGEETAIGVSSPAVAFAGYEQPTSFAGPPPHDQVTLDLRAEVVIYGRTRPGTAVFLSGARIPVGADGTFEARFALPPAPSRAGAERTDSRG
jgi:hypothetical protein